MANRNLADEVDALAKGLASLRVANKRTVSRVAALEDRELQALTSADRDFDATLLRDSTRRTIWQRIRAWWAR